MAEAHLLLIARRAGTLELLVTACPRQGAVPPHEISFLAQIALPQGKLDQLAHLNSEDWFGGRCHRPSLRACHGHRNRIIGARSYQVALPRASLELLAKINQCRNQSEYLTTRREGAIMRGSKVGNAGRDRRDPAVRAR